MRRRWVLIAAIAAIELIVTCPLVVARPVASFVATSTRTGSTSPPPSCFTSIAPQPPQPTSRLRLWYSRYDNLVSGIAEISVGTSIGVLWSEYAILVTGCGPLNLSDGLERFCYQAVICAAGLIIFTRIVTQKDLTALCQDFYGELQEFTLIQVRAAEWLSLLAVLGAFVALGSQMWSGQQMNGLTGIDVQMCRAIRDLSS